MNASRQKQLRYFLWLYFLILESLVVTSTVLYLFSLDSWGRSSLLDKVGSNHFTAIYGCSLLFLLLSLPVFFWLSRRIGQIALTTVIGVALIALLTPRL